MSVSQLINEIVSEWAYRVNDGMPDPKNPTHLNELGIVLSEMGLSNIKKEIINTLTEAEEGGFKNPALNKKIRYKNDKGEDKEGIVGNLLRLPKEHPGRLAAEKTLPPEGSPERDALNKDLGGEGQPTKPEDEKGKEGGEAGAGEEDKAKAAQAMFDPKNDPAMAARMDKEKEVQAQLAADAEKQKVTPETPANQKTNKELAKAAGFDNVGSWYNDLNKKAMSDDPEVASQAQKDLDTYEKNKEKDASAAKGGPGSGRRPNPKPEDGEESQPTSDEPQATGPEGGPDAETPEQEPDRPDTTPPQDTTTPSDDSGLSPQEKYKKQKAELKRKEEEKAALEKLKIDNPDLFMTPEKQKKFAQLKKDLEVGTEKMKKAKEAADKQTKELTSKFKQRKSSNGEKLDVETTENGSFIIGVEHGEGTQSTKDTVDNIKKLSPDTKVMFVGEGGMSKDENGNLELSGEQAEIRDAVKGHFSDSKESSWDENANIADDNSPVFDEVGKSLGGSKSKSKAAIWSNMVGQGDDLNADDYLDDEGKAWLVDQAKKGGSKEFDGDVDWANLSDAQKKDLYELNFRDDQNYGETEISKAQEAYNGFRQKELDRKIKEAEDEGYTVIAPVGNSHVDMWRQRNKGEQKPEQPSAEKPEEPTTEPEQPSAEKPEQPKSKYDDAPDGSTKPWQSDKNKETPSDTEKPEDKKDDKEDIKKEKPGQEATSSSGKKIYSVGGGYYSDKPNGPAKYVRTEWVVDLAFSDILTEDVFALFEKTISATLSNGKKITVQELPPRAVKKATQKAKAAAASYKEPEQKPQAPKGETPPTDKKVPPQPPVPPKKAATPPPPPPPPPKRPAVPPPPPTRKEEPAEPGNPKGEYKPDPKLEPKVDDKGNVAGTDIPAQNEENPNPKFVNKVSTKLDDFYKDVLDEEERAQKAVIEKMKAEGKLPADFKEVHPLPFGFKHPALKDNPELQKEFSDAVKGENKPPHWDLCKVSIPGTNKFCDENIGIPRDKMPQLGGKPKPGSEGEAKAKRIADQNVRKKMGLPTDGEIPADKKQEYDDLYAKENTQHVNVEKEFEDYLKSEGINVSDPVEVPASSLKATQSELVGEQIVGMVNSLEQDPNNPFITAPIMVTRDGYVIDGHHRWATIQAYNMKHTPPNGDKEPIKMKVRVVDEDIETHIPRANAFAEKMGIETMSGKGKQKDEPKPATSTKPSTLSRIKEKLKNWNKKEKEYFNMGYHKPGSDARKSISERLRDKASGAWKAVKDGFKHEVKEFKTAGVAVGKLFSEAGGWNSLSHHEKDAIKSVGVKIVTTALFGAAMGGLSYGAVGFAKHVAIEFVPHVIAETFLKGAGRAALFADAGGESEMDAQFIKFTEMIADGLENMKISPEQMEEMIDSYNKKKEENAMKKETLVIDEIILEILNENPIKKADDVLNQTVKNPETGKDIKVASALKYKGSKNKGQIQAYQSAVGLLKKAGVSNSELGATEKKPKEIPGQGLGFRKTKEKDLEPTAKATKPTKGSRIIGGKDKTLAKVDTLKSKEFTQRQIPDDSKFAEKNKKFQVGPPPQPYKLPKEMYAGAKVPPRHLKALERMMNTKFSNETAKWSHFSDLPGGAGQISAQAGELMTMIGTTLDDKQAEAFYKSLIEHEQKQIEANPDLKIEGKRIVTKSWIQAAMNNRKAIRNRLAKEYPGAVIEAGSWDTQGEVEAMGLNDYKKNKGFSTDAYFKIKTKDGQQILDEVSLKKSTAVNFLNSGTGKLVEWDSNIPDEINPNVYQKNQREALGAFGSNNIKKLQAAVAKDPDFQAMVKSKKIDLETAISKLKSGKGSRDINKVVLSAITILAKKGDKGAIKYLQQVQDTHKKHQKDVITALGSNPKLKQGMLASIREEFPLKAVGEGEESMAIGPNSLDRAVLQDIFQTSNFEEIKQGLFAVTDEEPPYLAYKAGKKGRVIPIATIGVREDGVGYGGQIKFEMQLDRRFAKILEAANKNIYG